MTILGGVLSGGTTGGISQGGGGGGGCDTAPGWVELTDSDFGALVDTSSMLNSFDYVTDEWVADFAGLASTLVGYDHAWPYRPITMAALLTAAGLTGVTDLNDVIFEIGITFETFIGDGNQAGHAFRFVETAVPDNSGGVCMIEVGATTCQVYNLTATATAGLGGSFAKSSLEWQTVNLVWQRLGGGYTQTTWDTSNNALVLGPYNGDYFQVTGASLDPADWRLDWGVVQRSGGVAPLNGETQAYKIYVRAWPRDNLRAKPS